jgi:hypothetical protein
MKNKIIWLYQITKQDIPTLTIDQHAELAR